MRSTLLGWSFVLRGGLLREPELLPDSRAGQQIDNGKRGKKTVPLEPEVHLGGGFASAVFCSADAVGDQFHYVGIHGVNPDFEPSQQTLSFFPFGKGWLDVLQVLDNRPEESRR